MKRVFAPLLFYFTFVLGVHGEDPIAERQDIIRDNIKEALGIFKDTLSGDQDVTAEEEDELSADEIDKKQNFTIEVSEAHAISANKQADKLSKKGHKALSSGLYEVALKLYLEALEHDKGNVELLFDIGSLYHKLNNTQEAQKYYEKVLSFNNQHHNSLVNYLALQIEKTPIQAMHKLHVIQKLQPSSPLLQAQLAMVYTKLGIYKKAKQHFIKSLSLSPYSMTIRYNYATLLHNMGELEHALEEYNILLSQIKNKSSFSNITTEAIINRMTEIYAKLKQ